MHARTLPRHARTGQLALGWRRPRPGEDPAEMYPIWPILGGAPDDGDDDEDDDDSDDDQDDAGDDSDKDDAGDEWSSVVKQWKAEGLKPAQVAERLKASRKWEDRAKRNKDAAAELARLKREGMSETEAAVAAARAEERVKGGERIARSVFLATAKGRIPDPKDVAEEINLRKYVDEETGEVDDDAIAALVDKLAPRSGKDDDEDDDQDERDTRRRRRAGSGYQGARNGSGRSKSKRGATSGVELYEELIGPRRSTAKN